MCVETIRWFHPLVWWIGAELIEERERDCDESVLKRRSRPEEADGEAVDLLALEDLVYAKKTQRDKDWPMISRLLERSGVKIASTRGRSRSELKNSRHERRNQKL